MAKNVVFNWKRPGSLGAWGAAIRRQREGLELTLDDVADATGISKPYLSNIETARAPGPPSEEKLVKIAKVLKMEAGVLLAGADYLRAPESIRAALAASERGGDVPRRAGDGAIDLDMVMGTRRGKAGAGGEGAGGGGTLGLGLRKIPVINKVAAGTAGEFGDLSYPAGVADAYVMVPEGAEGLASAFGVRIVGDSMMPEYAEGELIVVGPGDGRDGDDCVVRLGPGEDFATTFKRIFYVKDESGEAVGVRLVPLNGVHAERKVGLEEVTGMYPLMYRLVPRRVRAGRVKASERIVGG